MAGRAEMVAPWPYAAVRGGHQQRRDLGRKLAVRVSPARGFLTSALRACERPHFWGFQPAALG